MAEHIVSPKIYFAVFFALMILTGVTAWVAFIDLSFTVGGRALNLNPAVALLIAFIKATLVILFFMHVKYSTRLTKIVVVAGLFWLAILLVITMTDYLSRHMMTYPTIQ